MTLLKSTLFAVLAAFSISAAAQPAGFSTGPVFQDFGPVAKVEMDAPIPKDTMFKVAFDVAKASKPGGINRSFESAARFINMHVAAGVPLENIKLAIVVHGGASGDLTHAKAYARRNDGAKNGSAALIAKLQQAGVTFHLCGQSAAYAGISKSELLAGVKMELSAMTAHALLQQGGYTVNPF